MGSHKRERVTNSLATLFALEPDEDEAQPMGDPSKGELTEQEETQFSDKRSEALAAFSEGEWNKSIEIFTEAIILNPHNAVVFAKRGACFLKLKKPKACIRDCDRAIELNPDSAPAYKNRGRAHRLLGNFVEAARDLRQACKIDFDEQTDEWLKEVTPNVSRTPFLLTGETTETIGESLGRIRLIGLMRLVTQIF